MASFGKLIKDGLGKLLMRELLVEHVLDVSASFRRLDCASEQLRGARCAAGDKIQLMFDGGPRTYSPFAFDPDRGALSLLAYLHADTPSGRWGRRVQPGDRVRVFGPRASLALESLAGPLVVFGDETSFAVARALREARGASDDLTFVFETSNRAHALPALRALELPEDGLVERREDEAHLGAVDERVRGALARDPRSRLVLTGKAQSIQTLRKSLKAQPLPYASQAVKAYWAPGKRGLD